MQGRLLCELGTDGHIRGSWQFGFNKQITPLFELENGKWTVDHSRGQQFKDTLDSDRELTELLVKIANGDSRSWLQQVWERWREMRETTGPPTTPEDTVSSRATAIRPGTWILPLFFSCAVIIVNHVGDH